MRANRAMAAVLGVPFLLACIRSASETDDGVVEPTVGDEPAPLPTEFVEIPTAEKREAFETERLPAVFASLAARVHVSCPNLDVFIPPVESHARLEWLVWHASEFFAAVPRYRGSAVQDLGDELMKTRVYDTQRCTGHWLFIRPWNPPAGFVEVSDDLEQPGLAQFAMLTLSEPLLDAERVQCDDPRHGFGCMYMEQRYGCSATIPEPPTKGWNLHLLSTGASRWFHGPLPPQVRTYWPIAEAERIRGQPPIDPSYAASRRDVRGIIVSEPEVEGADTEFDDISLYAADLFTAPSMFALALVDHRQTRHAWIGHTRSCLAADWVQWLGHGNELFLGFAHVDSNSASPQVGGTSGLFVVDTRDGQIYSLQTPESRPLMQAGPITKDELWIERGSLVFVGGNKVSTRDLRQRIDSMRPD